MDVADLSPGQARERFRAGERVPTAGWCRGWTQANLIAVPERLGYDLLLFAHLNPRACPVLDVGEPGAWSTRLFPGDLRTDLPGYRLYRDGAAVADLGDVVAAWRDDLVPVLIGCSFTFERALLAAGVPLRHLELGTNVPMYVTGVACEPVGSLSGPLVVSMRPVPEHLVKTAVEVSGRYPMVHGTPVHVGDPSAIGIADLARPDFGDPVEVRPGETPVFWACGVTPQAAVMAGKVEYAIGHLPGHMAILDTRDDDYRVNP
ncbi:MULTISPECIES: putative hydro-lyase [unclassified Nonomuraea]|uniref:putative hydro-lyase n=1 Tax=unclassified Nonomuraea TaxID=2593643 RepID=UPI001BB12BDF|nr:putative hydro-lyase [Nonomuraea sp. KC401]